MSTLLAATDLVVRYNEQIVLEGATLGISEGEKIGLVGRNGCGKSTFLKILARAQTPDADALARRRVVVVSYLTRRQTISTRSKSSGSRTFSKISPALFWWSRTIATSSTASPPAWWNWPTAGSSGTRETTPITSSPEPNAKRPTPSSSTSARC